MRATLVILLITLASVVQAQDCVPYNQLQQGGMRPVELTETISLDGRDDILYAGHVAGVTVFRVDQLGGLHQVTVLSEGLQVEEVRAIEHLLCVVGGVGGARRLVVHDIDEPAAPVILYSTELPEDAEFVDGDRFGAWLSYPAPGETADGIHRHRWVSSSELVYEATLEVPSGRRFQALRHPWAFLAHYEYDEWGYQSDFVETWDCGDPENPVQLPDSRFYAGMEVRGVQIADERVTVHGYQFGFGGTSCSSWNCRSYRIDRSGHVKSVGYIHFLRGTSVWASIRGERALLIDAYGWEAAIVETGWNRDRVPVSLKGRVRSTAEAGGTWFLVDEAGTLAVDLRSPVSMPEISSHISGGGGSISASATSWGLMTRGDTVFSSSSMGLNVFAVDEWGVLERLDTLGSELLTDMVLVGDILFASDYRSGYGNPTPKLNFCDVADPTSIQSLGSIVLPVFTRQLDANDATLYGAAEEEGLVVVDIGDPQNPVSAAHLFQGEAIEGVQVWDDLLLLGGQDLLVCTLDDPHQPAVALRLPLPEGALHLLRHENLLLVSLGDSGLRILDLADPLDPVFLAELSSPAKECVVEDGLLYVRGYRMLAVVDIADPSLPVELARYDHGERWFDLGATSAGVVVGVGNQPCRGHYALKLLPLHCNGDPTNYVETFEASIRDDHVVLSWEVPGAPSDHEYRITADSELGSTRTLEAEASGFGEFGTADYQVDFERGGRITYRLESRFSGGSWETLSTTHVDLPTELTALLGAWPNPFNPQVTVLLYQAEDAPVDVAVHDVLGRHVRQLHDGTMPAGRHELTWDGRNESGDPASSGVYFVRYSGGGVFDTRKLVLLR
jgi:hypothetical protein